VTAAFAVRADGRYLGRIEGLALGANVVTAQLPDGRGARITITNHPSGGPVLSGPQVQPWSCNPGASDALCTRAPSYQYFYVPAALTRRRRRRSSVGLELRMRTFCLTTRQILRPLR